MSFFVMVKISFGLQRSKNRSIKYPYDLTVLWLSRLPRKKPVYAFIKSLYVNGKAVNMTVILRVVFSFLGSL